MADAADPVATVPLTGLVVSHPLKAAALATCLLAADRVIVANVPLSDPVARYQ
jgi:hypothetical protein